METPSPDSSNSANAAPVFELQAVDSGAPQGSRTPKVGDQIAMKIVGFSSPDEGVQIDVLPGGASLQDQGWLILPSTRSDASFFLVPLRGGELSLTGLLIEKKGEGSAMVPVARTNGFKLQVQSSLKEGEKDKPVDFRPPVLLGFPWKEVGTIGFSILLALAIAATWLIRRQRAKRPKALAANPMPARSADAVALEKLGVLHHAALWEKGQFKAHYFAVSEILKEYFERRFGFDAMESTSAELLRGLEAQGLSNELLLGVRACFDKLDRVKFTDEVPEPHESGEVITEARQIVLKTRVKEVPLAV